jgi:hypothetical protein
VKNVKGSTTGRAILVTMSIDDNIYTFIFGNAFGGTVRPCCEPFEASERGLELNASGNGEDFFDFSFVVFLVGVALGSYNTIPVTMARYLYISYFQRGQLLSL